MRSISLLGFIALGATVSGCGGDGQVPYYADRFDPTIDGLDVASEAGNIGGQTVTIQGSGFGSEAGDLVVLLGNHNAEVLSVSANEIVVKTPRGPITGGAVDLVVATETGYTELVDAYTYDVTSGDGTPLYDGQTAYVVVQNMWASCYGGLWDNPDVPGCNTISYTGQTGTVGSAEFFRSRYPRIHTTEFGWLGSSDYSDARWHLEPSVSLAFPSGMDNLRRRVGELELKNSAYEGEELCIDPTADPVEGNQVSCSEDGSLEYDLSRMQFCELQDSESGGTYRYAADWPVAVNFFSAELDNDEANFQSVDIQVNAPDVGLRNAEVTLPGSIRVYGETGFTDEFAWAVQPLADCPDGDGDGQALLDEAGMTLAWDPIADPDDLADDGYQASSYVMVSVSYLPFGWFGLQANGPRASIVVADEHEVDPATGRSRLEIPNSVLYQFPSTNFQWTTTNDVTDTGTLGTYDSGASYIILEIFRVTDYRLENDDGTATVFSYVTGDMSFVDWRNPADTIDDCSDCIDGDGDGWTDAADPDCDSDGSGVESGFSEFGCNDGDDNNGDGKIDARDPLCEEASDGESFCLDGVDNDDDGWIDGLDAECAVDGGQEAGDDTSSCADGTDNDGDGWVDSDDPGCENGSDSEDDGFGTSACNDGVDNDGHGDADALDPYCIVNGALTTAEAPATFSAGCSDDLDNEVTANRDGFIDSMDPDCELGPRELTRFFIPSEKPWVPQCYDGIDNDGDGSTDAADSSCWNPDAGFTADGFFRDESASRGTSCSDGTDDDADGLIDGKDPDCVVGDAANQVEGS
jgi:hypothetical protein